MEYGGGSLVRSVRMDEVWFMSRARLRLLVITLYLVRARDSRRPPPPATTARRLAARAQSRVRWREVSPSVYRVRSHRLRASEYSTTAGDARAVSRQRYHRPPTIDRPPASMPRVKPACVRRVSIGTYPSARSPNRHTTVHRICEFSYGIRNTEYGIRHSKFTSTIMFRMLLLAVIRNALKSELS